uniref:AlNc14C21G2189 protein n=1 Tax=Albugo laibachii Nc14 TaxID=890382 RepID=F0W5M4_9STRA|nr:AlNc14C21G2189 [Albugo laibachii Nc14]|eukprot:CCA16415.1 AlNc14C21G2189 [Albugo laibachii Nc14]
MSLAQDENDACRKKAWSIDERSLEEFSEHGTSTERREALMMISELDKCDCNSSPRNKIIQREHELRPDEDVILRQ